MRAYGESNQCQCNLLLSHHFEKPTANGGMVQATHGYCLSHGIRGARWKIEHAANPLRWNRVWIIISVVLLVASQRLGVFVATFVFITHYCRCRCHYWRLMYNGILKNRICRTDTDVGMNVNCIHNQHRQQTHINEVAVEKSFSARSQKI